VQNGVQYYELFLKQLNFIRNILLFFIQRAISL